MSARSRAHLTLAAASSSLLGLALLLSRYPPQTCSWYPVCPFHQWTGLLCPGCGATRALAALACGSFAESLHANPLVIPALLCTSAYLITVYLRTLRGDRNPWPTMPSTVITASLSITAAFTIVRNLA